MSERKTQRVAVIGAGGLTAAIVLKLAQQGMHVLSSDEADALLSEAAKRLPHVPRIVDPEPDPVSKPSRSERKAQWKRETQRGRR